MKAYSLSMIAVLGIFAAGPAGAQGVDDFDRATNNQERSIPGSGDFENPLVDEPGYVHNPAECSAPGTDQYSVIVQDNGMGKTWAMTNDTRYCSQAGIDDPVFKADGN